MEPIEALRALKQINIDYYGAAHMAKENDKFIAYVNAFTPVELLYAMDVIPIYPENHAVIIGARKMTPELAAAAEGMGYSMDLCSYARCDLGFYKDRCESDVGPPETGSVADLKQPVRDPHQMVRGSEPNIFGSNGPD